LAGASGLLLTASLAFDLIRTGAAGRGRGSRSAQVRRPAQSQTTVTAAMIGDPGPTVD